MANKNNLEIRLSSTYNKPSNVYDPANIENAAQHITLTNIYTPLIEYTPEGKIVSAIAKSFYWSGNEARFEINTNLKTIDGHNIDARDIDYTFRRLFILKTNTHGDLKNILCPDTSFKSLNDACPNFETRENGKLFVIKFKKPNSYLFPMLTAMDYAIIPRQSVDSSTLKIIDYRNTSGPYYIEENTDRHLVLKANPNHFHYSNRMPQKVEFVYIEKATADTPLRMFIEGKIDHVATIGSRPEILLDNFLKDNRVNLHITEPIWLRYISFTEKGRKELSEQDRIKIANLIKPVLLDKFLKLKGYRDAEQLFPVFSKGALNATELLEIKKGYSHAQNINLFEKKMTAWFFPKETINELKLLFPNTEFMDGKRVPCFIPKEERSDNFPYFYFAGTDMGFQEDISLLSYKINTENFYLTGEDGKSWIKKYIQENEEKEKITMLKTLHYKTLQQAMTIPIVFCPYVAIIKKPWKMNFPKYNYDNNFWQIEYGD